MSSAVIFAIGIFVTILCAIFVIETVRELQHAGRDFDQDHSRPPE